MPSTFQIERNRGSKEARQQLAVLRDKWPIAFPADAKDVRPLAISAAGEIAATMNWSLPCAMQACASADRAESLRAQIDQEGEILVTKQGRRDNPLLKHELGARNFVCRTLLRLGLAVEPIRGPGRPGATSWPMVK